MSKSQYPSDPDHTPVVISGPIFDALNINLTILVEHDSSGTVVDCHACYGDASAQKCRQILIAPCGDWFAAATGEGQSGQEQGEAVSCCHTTLVALVDAGQAAREPDVGQSTEELPRRCLKQQV